LRLRESFQSYFVGRLIEYFCAAKPLGSISPTFYDQFLRQYSCTKKYKPKMAVQKSCTQKFHMKKPHIKCW
jgi:hypothetical protein